MGPWAKAVHKVPNDDDNTDYDNDGGGGNDKDSNMYISPPYEIQMLSVLWYVLEAFCIGSDKEIQVSLGGNETGAIVD